MEMRIPRREHMHRTDVADPFHWYYTWGTRSFFWHRLKMAVAMFRSQKYPKLLDIGVGCGIFLPELAEHCNDLYGIDVHPNLHLVEDMLQKESVQATLTKASITDLPYPDKYFDAIVCMSVLEHLRELRSAVGEIHRVARDDASIVLGFPVENPLSRVALQISYIWHPGANLDDEHVSTHKDILQEIRSQLEIIQSRHFPVFVPLDWSLYYVCYCRVRKEQKQATGSK